MGWPFSLKSSHARMVMYSERVFGMATHVFEIARSSIRSSE